HRVEHPRQMLAHIARPGQKAADAALMETEPFVQMHFPFLIVRIDMIDGPARQFSRACGSFEIPGLAYMDAELEMLRHTSAFASSDRLPDTWLGSSSMSVWAAPDGIIGKQLDSFATRQ